MIIKNCMQILTVIFTFSCPMSICCEEDTIKVKKITVKNKTRISKIALNSGTFALVCTSPFFIGNHISAVFKDNNNVQPKDFLNLKKIGRSAYRTAPLTALVWYVHFMHDRSQLID